MNKIILIVLFLNAAYGLTYITTGNSYTMIERRWMPDCHSGCATHTCYTQVGNKKYEDVCSGYFKYTNNQTEVVVDRKELVSQYNGNKLTIKYKCLNNKFFLNSNYLDVFYGSSGDLIFNITSADVIYKDSFKSIFVGNTQQLTVIFNW